MKGVRREPESFDRRLERFFRKQTAGLTYAWVMSIGTLVMGFFWLLLGAKKHDFSGGVLFVLGVVLTVSTRRHSLATKRDMQSGPFTVEGTIIGISQSMVYKTPQVEVRTEQGVVQLLASSLTSPQKYLHKPVKIVYLRNMRMALVVESLEGGS